MNTFSRAIVIVALCMSGAIIFMLPFLREIYYIPMQTAFGYTNTEMGMLMSVFGAMSMIGYFPGGWLADRFSTRYMMALALLSTGLVGLYFSTLPSFAMCLVIHAFWGLSITLLFWSSMITATRNWAREGEQGRAFGFLEGGRGITEAVSGSIFGVIFVWLGSNDFALTQVILLFSATNISLAFLVWFSLKNQENAEREKQNSVKQRATLKDILEILKLPEVWLITIVIMAAYSGYWGSYYFAPYATSAFSLSVGMGVAIGVGKVWLNPFAAFTSGFVSDKVGISRAVFCLLMILVVTFFIFGILPHSPNMIIPMLINVVITALAIFALRGIYFALLEEGGIPAHMTGTAAGFISAIGFLPDVYMPYLGGVILDAYPEAIGY
ncbi:MAG: MFS transporter, partial [Emcibacteraceae bacterium]|nr:MFS transporter [Emcibacteraceae bacterium]